MIGQHIDLDAGDFKRGVPLKPLRIALCERCRALHHSGDLDGSQTTGLTFESSLNRLNLMGFGRYDFRVPSPSYIKLNVCAQTIEVATRRDCSTLNSSIGAALNHTRTA